MSFVGQCASCGKSCHVDAEGVGRTLRCDCGVDLFACEPGEFTKESFRCDKCGIEHAFNRDNAGTSVSCECGQTIVLPTVVLRLPVSFAADTPLPGKRKSAPRIHCPKCDTAYEVSKKDLNEPSECSCGCIFTVSIDKSRKLVVSVIDLAPAQKSDEKGALVLTLDEARSPSQKTGDDDFGKSEARKKSRSWLTTLGTAAVIGFLITSIVMFLMRDTGTGAVNPKSNVNATNNVAEPKSRGDLSKMYSPAEFALAIKKAGFEDDDAANETSFGMQQPVADKTEPRRNRAEEGDSDSPPSAKLRLPPLAKRPIPDAMEARQRIPIVHESIQGLTFDKAYELAFADYRQTRDLKAEADQTRDPEKAGEFRVRAGRTISLLQQTHDLGSGSVDRKKEVDNLRYFLTWMYYQAGCLPEAAVVGESLARWGERDEPATKEAALLALASTQEANSVHWGIPERLGELDRMKSIADVIAKRWPNHSDIDAIRMAVAQSFDAFGDAKKAADTYSQIAKDSDFYVAANLGAGNALWSEFRTNMDPDADLDSQQEGLLKGSRKYLLIGLTALQKDAKKPTNELLNVKLTLARLDLLLGKPADALKWLTDKPMPLVGSVVVAKPTGQQVAMPSAFVRSVFEALFAARTQSNDSAGAKAALQQMSKLLGPDAGGDVGNKLLGVAVNYVDELRTAGRISAQQVKTLEDMLTPLRRGPTQLTAENMLWFGEKWSELAVRALSGDLRRQCYANAAKEYGNAIKAKDFPKESRSAGLLRQVQLLRQAGEIAEAIKVTELILRTTPNVLQLQIEAASAIEELSYSKADPVLLVDAIDGPSDSPIWGWKRLVTAIHSVRFSSQGTDQHADQLVQSQVHLAKCQWLLGKATLDPVEKSKTIAAVSKMLSRLLQTTSQDKQPWFGQLEKLSQLVEA